MEKECNLYADALSNLAVKIYTFTKFIYLICHNIASYLAKFLDEANTA